MKTQNEGEQKCTHNINSQPAKGISLVWFILTWITHKMSGRIFLVSSTGPAKSGFSEHPTRTNTQLNI